MNRKHQKRHSRPYGCTYTSCDKSFGSKNDWKRHENTQHFQIETWRCREDSLTSKNKQCAKVVHRREHFQAHLKDHHHINDEEYIRAQTKNNRIGRNGQCGFWCGFCCEIVTLKKRGLEAWDERFSHIDDLHYKKGETIDSWVPLDEEVPKGFPRIHNQVVEECTTTPSPPSYEDEYESVITTREHSPRGEEIDGSITPQQLPCHARSRSPSLVRGNNEINITTTVTTTTTTSTPHGFDAVLASSSEHQQRQRHPPGQEKDTTPAPRLKVWYCCACMNGPFNCRIDDSCVVCQRKRCGLCVVQ